MRVGVFDSGIGGLTVLKELKKRYPNNDYIYVGDSKNLPYGEKTKELLYSLSCNIIDFLLSKKVDIIVIACGTVSSNVAKELRKKYSIKIIDIISPTIKYIENSGLNKVAVFATQATINSHIFKNSLNIEVIEEPCPEFVPLIEGGNIFSLKMNEAITKHLNNVNCDNIILGCTHYPVIEDLINANTINMSKNINLNNDCGDGTIICYFSYIDDNLLKNVKRIINNVTIKEW